MTSLEDDFYNFTVSDHKGNEIFKAKVVDTADGPIFAKIKSASWVRWIGKGRK